MRWLRRLLDVLRRPLVPYAIVGGLVLIVLIAMIVGMLRDRGSGIVYRTPSASVGELAAVPIIPDDPDFLTSRVPEISRENRADHWPPIDPLAGLIEASGDGLLPKLGPDGERSIDAYRLRTVREPNRPQIGIVLTELGMSSNISEKATLLPVEIGLAYSPYAIDASGWNAHGRSRGHEVLLEFPIVRASPGIDTGPMALSPAMSEQDLILQARKVLAQGSGYVGVLGTAGMFAADPETFAPVAQELAGRGLGFIELGDSRLGPVAMGHALPYASARLEIDAVLDPDSIMMMLGELEAMAIENGSSLGFMRPYPVNLDLVWRWSQGLSAKGLSLAPPSAILGVN